jgi:hypothetical protein
MAGKPPVLVGRSPFFKNRRAKNYDPKSFGERGAHGHFRGEVQPLLLGLLPVEHCDVGHASLLSEGDERQAENLTQVFQLDAANCVARVCHFFSLSQCTVTSVSVSE